MPAGRGFGFGRGRGGGQRKMFFLESCLMVLLLREPGYGYSLMTGLESFGFQTGQMDMSIIYRALRDLEASGLVTSTWDDDSLGPQRRVYAITQQGKTTLAGWMESLKLRRKEIEKLEAVYDAVSK